MPKQYLPSPGQTAVPGRVLMKQKARIVELADA
jgi:hypothetical protein